MSKCEEQLIKLFQKEHLKFEREKTFQDLARGKFRFDFYFPNIQGGPLIVEYDGEQHFQYIKRFYKKQTDFMKQKEHDRRKNSFCLAKEIPLYRIPYWELQNIHSFSDILQQKFLVKSKWHNDYLNPPHK